MSGIRSKNTRPELVLRKALHRAGFRYTLHAKTVPGKPDMAFPALNAAVFVHGCFWHGHECTRGSQPSSNVEFWQRKIGKNCDRDRRVRAEWNKDGWRVLTVWECEMKDLEHLQRRLSRFLDPVQSG